MKISLRNKWLVLSFFAAVILIVVDVMVIFETHGKSQDIQILSLDNAVLTNPVKQIKLMTVNMAHGRGVGINQIFQSNEPIKDNINNIGQVIARETPHVVAMQEADSPSWWSGSFSHVETVGKLAGMSSAIPGRNIDGLGLAYGSAILSKLESKNARQITFKKNIPTFSKGFVVVTCIWPGQSSFEFDAVSLHLDFARKSVRENQLSVLREFVKTSTRPIILMGDFNTDMIGDLLPDFLKDTQLTSWEVDDSSIITFPFLNSRIDWILVSQEFRIVEQTVLDDVLSDHKALTAVIELTNPLQGQ